jgi:hypothetical protein
MLPNKMQLGSGWEGRLNFSRLPGGRRMPRRHDPLAATVLDKPPFRNRRGGDAPGRLPSPIAICRV